MADAGCANRYDHYLKAGAAEARIAHPLFDPASQLDASPAAGPFERFLQHAWATGEDQRVSPYFDPAWFRTEDRWQQLLAWRKKQQAALDPTHLFGTVGAVALDANGHLAAATSTGGMTDKRWGRIGDSPIIGAGTYANSDCAVSGTGWGEYYIRTVAAHAICMQVSEMRVPIKHAAAVVINQEIPALGGNGGAIALDAHGNIAIPFNTDGMYRGWIDASGVPHVAIYGDEDDGTSAPPAPAPADSTDGADDQP